jgi:hypothetical protein
MPSRKRTVELEVVADTKKAATSLKNIEGQVKKTGDSFSKAGKLLAGAFAGRQVISALGSAIDHAEAMQSAYAATEQIIESTGGVAGITAEHIKELSKQQAIATGVSKDLVTEGNNVLLTFKNIANQAGEGNDIFDRTSAVMLDMAAVMGTDAKSGAIQLGKALNDPITGISALTRVGVTFTEEQKNVIRSMAEAGDVAGAQRIILEELESEFGGVAEATADATAKMAVAKDEILETAGTALLPFVEAASRVSLELTGMITKLDGLAMTTGHAKDSVEFLATAIVKQGQDMQEVNLPWSDFRQLLTDVFDEIDASPSSLVTLRDNIDKLGKQFGLSGEYIEWVKEEIGVRLPQAMSEFQDANRKTRNETDLGATAMAIYADDIQLVIDKYKELNGIELKPPPTGRFGYTPAPGYRVPGTNPDVLPQFHSGGRVPGPAGANVPIMAQAGETVIPRGGGEGGGVNVYVNGFVGSEMQLAQEIDRILTRRGRTSGLDMLR